jgi:hypothetical protein
VLPVTPLSVLTGASSVERVQADAPGDGRRPDAEGFVGVLLLPARETWPRDQSARRHTRARPSPGVGDV